ncbi:hypothetical protein [uncultured Acetobacteroides sp.]|uniref:hypothetical protein n=1 Tax=uncultured Acetobacteroides sp. TaxID=1760811 RepID=UPI0029F4E896|nr:hypothetical protein [uncultured Acetobacteroides sp.]
METLLDLRCVTITYVPEKKCLVQTWKAFCSTEEYQSVQEKSVEFIIAKGCKYFISDTTNAGLLKKEATDWATEVIVPKLKAAGINHLDIVLPQSAFTKMTISNLEKDLSDYMRYYNSYVSAINAI